MIIHTPEGGLMRRVFSRKICNASYGVVWLDGERCSLLHVPVRATQVAAAKYFDSISIYSDACCSVSDTLMDNSNNIHPSI